MTPKVRPSTRLGWVDAGRGLAILLVVLYHSAQWATAAGIDSEGWRTFNDVVATLRMPLFFTLAGLFAGKWARASWRDLWAAKLSLFLWVFVVWSVIDSFAVILGLIMQGERGNYLVQVASTAMAPIAPRFELWFIWALAIFFVLVKLAAPVPPWLQLAVTGAASFLALPMLDLGNVGWNGIAKYLFFFLLGLYGRERILGFAEGLRIRTGIPLVAVWASFAAAGAFFGWNALPGFYFATAVLGVAAGIAISLVLARITRLGRIGSKTLPVYLTHTSIVLVVYWVIWTATPTRASPMISWLVPPTVAAIAIVSSLALDRIVAPVPVLRNLYVQPPFFAGARANR